MKPRIEIANEKKLVGKQLTMSFDNYKVGKLWKHFMPKRKEIANILTGNLISMTVYKPKHFTNFKTTTEFAKWATVEVSNFENVSKEMETFILPGGLYAVFDYRLKYRPFNL